MGGRGSGGNHYVYQDHNESSVATAATAAGHSTPGSAIIPTVSSTAGRQQQLSGGGGLNGSGRGRGGPHGGRQRKEVVLAKVSLAIVVVFIVCHSVKWIPNIHELLHVS